MSNKENKKNKKKGFIRNTVINVAQDLVNAGNPLNPGGHILGSVADGMLMEVGDRKMAKNVYDSMYNQQKTATEELLDEMFMDKTASSRRAKQDKANFNAWSSKQNSKQIRRGGEVPQLTREMVEKQKRRFGNGVKKTTPLKRVSPQAKQIKRAPMNTPFVRQTTKDLKNTKKYLLAAGGVGAAAGLGMAGKHIYDQQKNAHDMLDEMFMEKTAGVRNLCAGVRMMKNPDSRKVVTGALTGSRTRAVKKQMKDIEAQRQGLTTAQKMFGKGKKLDKQYAAKMQQLEHEKDLSRGVRTRVAKGAAATGGVAGGVVAGKHMYDQQKNAHDMLDEMFMEKTAGVEAILNTVGRKLYTIPKTAPKMMGRYKELLTGKNVAGLEQSANQAKQKFFDAGKKYDAVRKAGANPSVNPNTLGNVSPEVSTQMYKNMMGQKQAYQAAKEGLQAEKNKVLATRVGTGVGAGLIAKDVYDQQKNAHDMLDEMFMEKTAGLVNVKKK